MKIRTFFHGSESAMVNPQSTRCSTSFSGPINKKTALQRVFKIAIPEWTKVDLKINYLDNAWGKLKPAIRSIFLDEPQCFISIDIFNAVHLAWKDSKVGATLYDMILEECGTFISADLQSLEGKCNDDPSLDNCRKMEYLCTLAGSEAHQRVRESSFWELGLELFPTRLCLASQLCDKVLSNIVVLIRDQRSGKSVDVSLLKNIMAMFRGDFFYATRFFEKPFVECAAEFYAAEAVQGFEEMMDKRFREDLHRMYDLFSETNLLGHINNALSCYILKTGKKVLAEGSSLQEFKDSVDRICISHFCEDVVLEKTVEQCFKDLGLTWKVSKISRFPFSCPLFPPWK
ncbi:hypothetical protein EUTSA_v10011144mg [Eutrema salsugineum]|uniref:Cullin N-terminal domain-containing protein n=1 Tax=Eutrema salsugineum TaxID=72664 RepID=V4LQ20_EUTSA|nr:hypothetical protein EUTSA_v10011144mg [Eutrema salsugineum]